jgi:hypothetical protein
MNMPTMEDQRNVFYGLFEALLNPLLDTDLIIQHGTSYLYMYKYILTINNTVIAAILANNTI